MGKVRANAFGFYTVNGTSVIEFPELPRAANMCMLLESVRHWNSNQPILMVTDNCIAHNSRAVTRMASELCIALVFNAPYSPHLNPIGDVFRT